MRRYLIFSLFAFIQFQLKAQIIAPNHSFSISPVLGAQAYEDQNHLLQDNIFGFDAVYSKNISQNKAPWVATLNAKSIGIALNYRDLSRLKGAKDLAENSFGKVIGLSAQLAMGLINFKKLSLNFYPSIGLTYTNKSYFNHPKNIILGTNINYNLSANIGLEIPKNQNNTLLMGLGFYHLSNGGMKIPNGGLNTVQVYLGVKHANLNAKKNLYESKYLPLQKNNFEFMLGFGKRGVYQQKHQNLYRSGLYIGYNFYYNDVITFKTGLDAVYYFKTFDNNNAIATMQYYGTSYDKLRLGASAGVDLQIWRLSITSQFGKYVHFNSFYDQIKYYWTFGPTYNITPKIGFSVKSYMHKTQADYINFGIVLRK
jgi:hypothetical protein